MTFRRQRETRGRCVGHNGGVGTGAWRLRALLAVLTGGLVVHALRYGLAGVDADHAAHAYLPWLQIVVATLVLPRLSSSPFAFAASSAATRSGRASRRGLVCCGRR